MFKTTRLFIVCVALSVTSSINAQQIYKFALKFDSAMFADRTLKDGTGTRLKEDTLPDSMQGIGGYLVQPDGTKYSIHTFTNKDRVMHVPKKLHKDETLKGIVDYREGDTLYIHFWYIVPGNNGSSPDQQGDQRKKSLPKTKYNQYVTVNDNEKAFLFWVPWDSSGLGLHYNIPMLFRCLTATNIPIRYDFSSKKTDASLLNFNVAYFWCRGRRKFFRNQDIQPRDEYFGVGPFFGFLQAQNDNDPTSEFALTYGVSGVYCSTGAGGLNIIPSVGFENGFTPLTSKTEFYFGIGLGINVTSFSSYHN